MLCSVRFTRALETSLTFSQDFASFIWCVSFLWAFTLLLAYFIPQILLGHSLLFAFVYIWSKYDPQADINLWGFLVKAYQFPFVLLGLRMLMGGGVIDDLLGLVAGHVYYVLRETVPQQYGWELLRTPQFVKRMVQAGPQRPAQPQGFPGRGYQVG